MDINRVDPDAPHLGAQRRLLDPPSPGIVDVIVVLNACLAGIGGLYAATGSVIVVIIASALAAGLAVAVLAFTFAAAHRK